MLCGSQTIVGIIRLNVIEASLWLFFFYSTDLLTWIVSLIACGCSFISSTALHTPLFLIIFDCNIFLHGNITVKVSLLHLQHWFSHPWLLMLIFVNIFPDHWHNISAVVPQPREPLSGPTFFEKCYSFQRDVLALTLSLNGLFKMPKSYPELAHFLGLLSTAVPGLHHCNGHVSDSDSASMQLHTPTRAAGRITTACTASASNTVLVFLTKHWKTGLSDSLMSSNSLTSSVTVWAS